MIPLCIVSGKAVEIKIHKMDMTVGNINIFQTLVDLHTSFPAKKEDDMKLIANI